MLTRTWSLLCTGLFLAEPALAQCFTATIEPYDCGAPNPVTLTTLFPQQYPVLCNQLTFAAQGAEPGSFGFLGLSAGSTCVPLGPPIDGTLLIDLQGAQFYPYAGSPVWTIQVPCGAPPGADFFAQSLHSKSDGTFELSNGLHGEAGFYQAEIGVTSVVPPPGLVSGVGPKNYQVTLKNSGNAPAMVDVTVFVGVGPGSTSWTTTFGPVQPFSTFTGTVSVPTPVLMGGNCGGSLTYDVTACSHFIDCDPSNNCKSTTTSIAHAFWDLDFDIVGAPSSAQKCSAIGWTVRVTNHGNVPSDNVCFITGINCSAGAGGWGCLAGPLFGALPFPKLWTGVVAPGQTALISISNYFISCSASSQDQYVKAEVFYSGGCSDFCGGSNNFAQSKIEIH